MGSIPITRTLVSTQKASAIRESVRMATRLPVTDGQSRRAVPYDAPKLLEFLSAPAVHAPIYTLPIPLNSDTVLAFINEHVREAEAGEGLLFVREDSERQIVGYSDIKVWPHWGVGELGGALHPNLQSQGAGARGAAMTFGWMFETLGLELICATAATNNVRTAKLLDGVGFSRMGEVESTRVDGTQRRSRVWEITKAAWLNRRPA